MKYYFAPMEAVTVYNYRNAFYEIWPDSIDKFFSPFISPTRETNFKKGELRDILPENNPLINLVPQLLTNNAEVFVRVALEIENLGYSEVNLNLGCPSGTVVSKRKGSGFLSQPEELDRFFDTVFSKCPVAVSVKTRLGIEEHDEFYRLLDIYNSYPISEMIIHPRVRRDMYRNTPDLDMFEYALKNSKNPVCYNGDIFSSGDYDRLMSRFPELERVMLGRGLVSRPGLVEQIRDNTPQDMEKVWKLYGRLLDEYRVRMKNDRNLLFKMKELWFYMINSFDQIEDSSKIYKKIKKSQNITEYECAVSELYRKIH